MRPSSSPSSSSYLHVLLIPIHPSTRSICKHICLSHQWLSSSTQTIPSPEISFKVFTDWFQLSWPNTPPRPHMPHQLVVWTHCLSTGTRTFIDKPIENRSNGLAMPHLHPHLYISSLLYIMWLHFLPHKTIVSIPLPLCLNFSAPPRGRVCSQFQAWNFLSVASSAYLYLLPWQHFYLQLRWLAFHLC